MDTYLELNLSAIKENKNNKKENHKKLLLTPSTTIRENIKCFDEVQEKRKNMFVSHS